MGELVYVVVMMVRDDGFVFDEVRYLGNGCVEEIGVLDFEGDGVDFVFVEFVGVFEGFCFGVDVDVEDEVYDDYGEDCVDDVEGVGDGVGEVGLGEYFGCCVRELM